MARLVNNLENSSSVEGLISIPDAPDYRMYPYTSAGKGRASIAMRSSAYNKRSRGIRNETRRNSKRVYEVLLIEDDLLGLDSRVNLPEMVAVRSVSALLDGTAERCQLVRDLLPSLPKHFLQLAREPFFVLREERHCDPGAPCTTCSSCSVDKVFDEEREGVVD